MAYITKEEVKAIRNALKVEFGKRIKFSVRNEHSMSVHVTILSSDIDFSNVMKYKQFDGQEATSEYASINHYYIDETFKEYEEQRVILNKIKEIILTAPTSVTGEEFYNNTDVQSDYFDVAYYYDISIGSYEKPYKLV